MPLGDRTGPMGQGPVTGRGLGYCSGYDSPGSAKGFGGGMGRGLGRGRGRGMGYGTGSGMGYGRGRSFGWSFGNFFSSLPWSRTASKDDEVNMLKAQAESLKRNQIEIEKRLNELEKDNG